MSRKRVQFEECYEEANMLNQTYYHGTSDVFVIADKKIKPPSETGNLREEFRNYNTNVVYVSSSYGVAKRVADKAAQKYGGKPVVYIVKPDFDTLVYRTNYEYTTDYATITSKCE